MFRADGNGQIGLGHVMRCLAVAEMVGGTNTMFAMQEPADAVRQLLRDAGVGLMSLPATTDYVADARQFTKQLSGDELVVLDGYHFDAVYQRTILQRCYKLIVIDDLAAWHQYAHIVINHGGNAQRSMYQAEPHTQFRLGTNYALLREPFLAAGRQRLLEPAGRFEPRRVLVNLGGADPGNVSLRVVHSLHNQPPVAEITVVLGAANPHGADFEPLIGRGVRVLRNLTPEQMVAAIQNCDLAVVSCSTISYEVATVGKPFVGILTADNQLGLRDFYQQNQIALQVLDAHFTDAELRTVLPTSTEAVSHSLRQQRQFFDSRSGERIGQLFNTLRSRA